MLARIPLGGEIVKEEKIGNTQIYFCNKAYKNRSEESIQQILREAAQASMNIIVHNLQQSG